MSAPKTVAAALNLDKAPAKTAAEGPSGWVRIRAAVAAGVKSVDLSRVLAASLFVAVLVFASALASAYGALAGALGLLVPFAVWYAALTKHRAMEETRRRMDAAVERKEARLMTRPAPLRTPLDQGGQAPAAPWSAAGQGYGGED